jgi:filamentous hemagglutinin family protein
MQNSQYLTPKYYYSTFVFLGSLFSPFIFALPENPSLVSGNVNIEQTQKQMDIEQLSNKAIVNWSDFDIQSGESVSIVQPSSSAVILNRVTGNSPSDIYGKLSANGRVFLVNSNGVTFGANAQVNAGAFVASTLDIDDDDFLNDRYQFDSAGNNSTVVNNGSLHANTVALLGNQVINNGWITASLNTANDTPNIALIAADNVEISFGNQQDLAVNVSQGTYAALVENNQLIQADGGTILLQAQAADQLLGAAVNNTGIIQARGLNSKDGRILLLSDMSSGTTSVGGTLDASAISDTQGNGGFIETSAAQVDISVGAVVLATGRSGLSGQWLIDPNDLTIDATNASVYAKTLNSGTNVTLNTNNDGNSGGNGDIFVNADINWSSDNTVLTLQAQRNIEVNAKISTSGENSGVSLDTALSFSGGTWGNSFSNEDWAANNYIQYSDSGKITLSGKNAHYQQDGKVFEVINGNNTVVGSNSTGESIIAELEALPSSGNYALGVDVDATAYNFTPISRAQIRFDGLNNKISNLTITQDAIIGVGLFDEFNLASGVSFIKNLHIDGGEIRGNRKVGAFLGAVSGTHEGYFYNLSNSANVTGVSTAGNTFHIGGLIGNIAGNNSAIEHSSNSGTVSHDANGGGNTGKNIGGIIGYIPAGNQFNINNTSNSGDISGTENVGGLIGHFNGANSKMSDSFNTGAISAESNLGGLIGTIDATDNQFSLSSSYSIGDITGETGGGQAGGLVGHATGIQLSDSYSVSNIRADSKSGGLIGLLEGSQISKSYFSGTVLKVDGTVGAGGDYLGAIAGDVLQEDLDVTFQNVYWDVDKTPSKYGGSSTPYTPITDTSQGLTTVNMRNKSSYTGFDISSSCGGSGTWCIVDQKTLPGLNSLRQTKYIDIDSVNTSNKTYDQQALTTAFSHSSSLGTNPLVFNTAGATIQTNSANVGSYQGTNISINGFDSAQYDIQFNNSGTTLFITPVINTTQITDSYLASVIPLSEGCISGQGSCSRSNENALQQYFQPKTESLDPEKDEQLTVLDGGIRILENQ